MVFKKLFHKLPHLSIIAFIVKSWELFVVFGIIKLLRKIDEKMKKIAIIGAGYTGMIAARDLIKDNKVDIFEAEEKVGGMTATFEAYGTPLEKYYRHIFKRNCKLRISYFGRILKWDIILRAELMNLVLQFRF